MIDDKYNAKLEVEISELETYSLVIPIKRIKKQEFLVLYDRLSKIAKMLNKDDFLSATTTTSESTQEQTQIQAQAQSIDDNHDNPKTRIYKVRKGTHATFLATRETALRFLKLLYFGSKEQREAFAQEHRFPWKLMQVRGQSAVKKFKFTPKEVGIKAFPTLNTIGDFKRNKEAWKI